MPTLRRSSPGNIRSAVRLGFAAAALLLSTVGASAQNGFFDSLFGRRQNPAPSASAYADPFSQWNPFGWRSPEAPRPEMETGVAFCVRLCDGRFFPVQRHGNVTPAQTCSAFCPASQTRIFNGTGIESSVGPDGRAYRDLGTAFVYREKIVPGCTCNGKDAFGLVNTPVEDDPTLRAGDIVATNGGLMAYNGGGSRRQANFTPVGSYSGLSAELRRRLTETKVAPASVSAIPAVKPSEPPRSSGKAKRAQAER